MKKYFTLLILPFLFLNNVNASVRDITATYSDSSQMVYQCVGGSGRDDEQYCRRPTNPRLITTYSPNYQTMIQRVINEYNNNYSNDYPYYIVSYDYAIYNNELNWERVTLSYFPSVPSLNNEGAVPWGTLLYSHYTNYPDDNYIWNRYPIGNSGYSLSDFIPIISGIYSDDRNYFYFPFRYYTSNFPFYNGTDTSQETNYSVPSLNLTFNQGDAFIPYLDSNFYDYYTEVNLDNYAYAILTLKTYNQTESFSTTLQVKGSIGITPVYNFGRSSKDSIIGSQVQDRCNPTYENYTPMSFFIINSDLQNNAVYYVKSCSSGSSFKFDNTVFDVTLITNQDADSPTVTIGGTTYNTLPYDTLPSTATKNEEDNYIPGQSGSATDTGGLDSAIKNIQQKMSEIWDTFIYFTQFVNQIFSTLPVELRTVLISAFIIAIILGLIKIFTN